MAGKLVAKIAVACLLYCTIGSVGAAHCELKTRDGETSCGGTLKSFVEKTGADNPFASALSSINHFSSKANLKTAFHDWDNDGRIDLLIGSTQNLTYFKNTASGFVQQTTSATDPFHAVDVHADDTRQYHYSPTFVDLYSQGIPDMVLHKITYNGEYANLLYKNTGTKGSPAFVTPPVIIPGYTTSMAEGNKNYANSKFCDMDYDGDLDWVISKWDGTLAYLENIGNKTSPFFKYVSPQDCSNPFFGVVTSNYGFVEIHDLDKDGDYDVIAGDQTHILYYYENTGNAQSPIFTKRENEENPFNGMISTGQRKLAPCLIDLSGTGRYDFILPSENPNKIGYYHNVVDGKSQSFTEQWAHTTNPFNGIKAYASSPRFYDFNNDGNVDLLLGESNGKVHLYLKNGTTFNDSGYLKDSNGVVIDVGSRATLQFVDLTGDGKPELILGDENLNPGDSCLADKSNVNVDRKLHYYLNTGTLGVPRFELKSGTDSPLNNIDCAKYCNIAFIDLKNTGKKDLVISGHWSKYYENVGSASSPSFSQATNHPLSTVWTGYLIYPAFIDVDLDGDIDLLMGKSTSSATCTKSGELLYYENVGNVTTPSFQQRTNGENPFRNLVIGRELKPAWVDINKDNYYELVVAQQSDDRPLQYFVPNLCTQSNQCSGISKCPVRESLFPMCPCYEDTHGGYQCESCNKGSYEEKITEYMAVADLTTATCKYCPSGRWNSQISKRPDKINSIFACTECGIGKFGRTLGAASESDGCEVCPIGRYSPNNGTSSFAGCQYCPAGQSTNGMSGQGHCVRCPEGKYTPDVGMAECLVCSAGTFANASGMNLCHSCQAGLYNDAVGSKNCTACPSGTTSNEKSTFCFQCSAGEYLKTDVSPAKCVECSTGKYSEAASTTCTYCPPGRWTKQDRKNGTSSGCFSCPPGKYATTTGAVSSATCIDCPKGTFSSAIAASHAGACNLCAPGKYNPSSRGNSSSSCIDCPGKNVSTNFGAHRCVSCESGKYTNSGKSLCLQCLLGYYLSASGCKICPSGSMCPRKSTAPLMCGRGEYSPPESPDCLKCGIGKFAPHKNQSNDCLPCPMGQYQEGKGSMKCKPCPENTFSTSIGNVAPEKCLECVSQILRTSTGGKVGAVAVSSCGCKEGTYINSNRDYTAETMCLMCPEGSECKGFNYSLGDVRTALGFWRSSTSSVSFHSCDLINPENENCIGGSVHNNSQCREGHTGPLCMLCEEGWIANGDGVCQVCKSNNGRKRGSGVAVAFGAFLFFFLIAITMIFVRVVRNVLEEPLEPDHEDVSAERAALVEKRRGSTAQGWKSLHELESMARDAVVDSVSEELQGQAEGLIKNNVEVDQGATESQIAERLNTRTRTSITSMLDEKTLNDLNKVKHDIKEAIQKISGFGRIFVSFIQVFSNLTSTFTIPWPKAFTAFMESPIFKALNVDLTAFLSNFEPCALHSSFLSRFAYHVLLMPILLLILLISGTAVGMVTYIYIEKSIARDETSKTGSEDKPDSKAAQLNDMKAKRFKMVRGAITEQTGRFINMIVFLLYPGLSVKIFTIFKCVELDEGMYYLMQDVSVRCYNSDWNDAAAIAAVCIIIYVIGIPATTFFLLYRKRDIILDGTPEEQDAMEKVYGSLYTQYEGQYYWWEVAEMIKKMMLTGGLVLLAPGSTAQILVGVLIALVYFTAVMKLEPYEDIDDDILQTISTVQILLTLLMGFALRSDDGGIYENVTITVILILVNSSMFMITSYLIVKTTAQLRGILWQSFCCCLHVANKKRKLIGHKLSLTAIQPLNRKLSHTDSKDRNNFKLPTSTGPPPSVGGNEKV